MRKGEQVALDSPNNVNGTSVMAVLDVCPRPGCPYSFSFS
jgi:hypothetical protein